MRIGIIGAGNMGATLAAQPKRRLQCAQTQSCPLPPAPCNPIPRTNGGQMIKTRPPSPATEPLTCTYLVAGAGFEPATSGL